MPVPGFGLGMPPPVVGGNPMTIPIGASPHPTAATPLAMPMRQAPTGNRYMVRGYNVPPHYAAPMPPAYFNQNPLLRALMQHRY